MSKSSRRGQIALFLHLEHMEKAGVPILQSLDAAANDADTRALGRALEAMTGAMRAGMTLSEAMGLYPRLFDDTTVALVALGEKAGRMGRIFEKCRQHFRRAEEHAEKMRRATRYPKFAGVIILGLALLRGETLLPQAVALTVFFCVVIVGGRRYSPLFRHATDHALLLLPRAGRLIAQVSHARFADSLAMLYESGIPLKTAIGVAAASVPNFVIRAALERAGAAVTEGRSLHAAFSAEAGMDRLALAMIKAGEDSGNLAATLHELADYYDRRTDEALTAVEQLAAPLLTLVAGALLWFSL
jgi:type IV pilus assembly protein PilC